MVIFEFLGVVVSSSFPFFLLFVPVIRGEERKTKWLTMVMKAKCFRINKYQEFYTDVETPHRALTRPDQMEQMPSLQANLSVLC